MNYLLMLMLVYIVYTLIAFVISGGKIISPSVIFSFSFTFMICLAYIFKDILFFKASYKTFSIFAIGGCIFLLAEIFAQIMCSSTRKHRNKLSLRYTGIRRINTVPVIISVRVQRLFVLIMLASVLIAFYYVQINTSAGRIGHRLSILKNMLLYNPNAVRFRFVVAQLYKINTSIAYFCAYILIYNTTIYKKRIMSQKRHVVIIVLFIIFSMLSQAARQPAIELLLYLPLVYLSLKLKRRDKKEVYRLIKKSLPILSLGVVLFYYTSTLVGRRKTQRGILEYLAVYFCGGLFSFNLHVDDPARNHYWGQSSFADIYGILIRLGLVPETANMKYHTFDLYGNTVTMFGRWYEDFGSVGVFIMTFLVSFLFAHFFYRRIDNVRLSSHHVSRMLYCKFLISLVWAGYDDRIRALLSMQTVITIILTLAMYEVLINKRRIRRNRFVSYTIGKKL